ncbi:hypothetical protein ACFWA4_16080 [Streptomyces sp. NPDC060011]|uniref:hypothetical protein n=1 Tax=Streptomyces sp. NPDC060011 TaxID=3347037 RepID=UPI0036949715
MTPSQLRAAPAWQSSARSATSTVPSISCFAKELYDRWLAYAEPKTANILFAVEAAKRWAPDGITVNACNPGRIWGTRLGRHMDTPPASFDPSGASGVS